MSAREGSLADHYRAFRIAFPSWSASMAAMFARIHVRDGLPVWGAS